MNAMNAMNPTRTDSEPAAERGPTWSQRLALVRAYQLQAMARPDPLAANLGTITADLMSFAHALAFQVQTQLAQGTVAEEARRQFAAHMELYLKMLRQSDRLVQLERQLGAAAAEPAPAP